MTSESRDPGNHARSLAEVEHELIHHTELPRTALSRVLDGFVDWTGKAFSWLWLAVVGVILYSVISRYVFAQGSVFMEEVQWHLAGAAWLVGLAFTLVSDDHVRVDILHEKLSLRAQAWIELGGILLLLMPFLAISLWEAIPYFWSSFQQNEVSPAPTGLPARWALKLFLPLCFALLLVAGLSRLLKCTALLFGRPRPDQHKP
ncbi:MAG: TRAP transporter small permease subunit [Kiloniellales bacterium]|nr:TRAP transporter small permease subunit [Kiloniellales bacterium]